MLQMHTPHQRPPETREIAELWINFNQGVLKRISSSSHKNKKTDLYPIFRRHHHEK
jgi:hypothetical protein